MQFLKAAIGHDFTGVDALHSGFSAFRNAGFDGPRGGLAVLNYINEGRAPVVLDRRTGQQDLTLKSFQQQARVDELVGEKRAFLVVVGGAQFDGAGGGVNLVVERGDLAGGELMLVGTAQASSERPMPCFGCENTSAKLSSEMVATTVMG